MSANSRIALALGLLALLGGCEKPNVRGSNTQQAVVEQIGGNAVIALSDDVLSNDSTPPTAPMAWTLKLDATAPVALYGPSDKEVDFAVRCDPKAQTIIVQRAGTGSTISLEAGGHSQSYSGTNSNGKAQAQIALDDPFLDALTTPAGRISASAGGDAIDVPSGRAIRRVIEICRNPATAPATGAVIAGSVPCPDCDSIDITLTFAGEPGPGRYRLVQDYRGKGSTTLDGLASVTDASGNVLRLQPDTQGPPVMYIERVSPDTWVFRTGDNKPNAALKAYPLTRQP
jgi:hypothetical protein